MSFGKKVIMINRTWAGDCWRWSDVSPVSCVAPHPPPQLEHSLLEEGRWKSEEVNKTYKEYKGPGSYKVPNTNRRDSLTDQAIRKAGRDLQGCTIHECHPHCSGVFGGLWVSHVPVRNLPPILLLWNPAKLSASLSWTWAESFGLLWKDISDVSAGKLKHHGCKEFYQYYLVGQL